MHISINELVVIWKALQQVISYSNVFLTFPSFPENVFSRKIFHDLLLDIGGYTKRFPMLWRDYSLRYS